MCTHVIFVIKEALNYKAEQEFMNDLRARNKGVISFARTDKPSELTFS